jgi:[DsrC]-trisulfide reductase subunit O
MSEKERPVPDPDRRRLLARGGAIAGAMSAAPGLLLSVLARAKPADQPVSSKQRWGILIDTHKCMDACNRENGLDRGDEWRSSPEQKAQWIRKVTLRDRATGHQQSLPVLCQHCEFPPCVDVCPTGASFRRADGIVLQA